jgi:fructoselysine-6-P-deglycase FrlB-like protein
MNHVMATEIAAQAEVLSDCLEPLAERVGRLARPGSWITAGGCGDSAFAPAACQTFFDALGLQVEAATAMGLSGFTRIIAGDTVILSSISGNTRRTVEAAHVAKAAGGRVLALTCGETSALASIADEVIVLPFTPISRKTPHTLDYLVTLEALAALGLRWSGQDPTQLAEVIDNIPEWLDAARAFAGEAVATMRPEGKIFMLGAGSDLATASYGAAKFHEAGGIPAFAAETENFIHGMNFMAEPADSLFAVATTPLSIRRGAEVVSNFRPFLATASLVEPEPFDGDGWRAAFAALLSTTLKLQHLCLAYADRFGLEVELPRAGRPHGAEHAGIQGRLMAT